MGSGSWGSVPVMTYSLRAGKLSCCGSPELVSTCVASKPDGIDHASSLYPSLRVSSIIRRHIGDAPVTPEATLVIALLSLFPTQTPMIAFLVQPTVQLSTLLLVVPVLTAIGRLLILSCELGPNVISRALLSESMWLIKNVSCSESTLFCCCGLFS